MCGVIPLAAQVSQPPVFRAGTDLVEVDVIARDKNGTFVSDLAIDDFELQEDGKPYPVQQVYLRLAGRKRLERHASQFARRGKRRRRRAPASPSNRRRIACSLSSSTMRICRPAGSSERRRRRQTLFQSQLRDGDIGGVVSNGRMANGRLTSNRAELIKAAKDAKPSANVLSVEMDERLWPRLSEIEAVRIAVNDDKETLRHGGSPRVQRGQNGAARVRPATIAVRRMIHGKASQFSTNVRVEATRTLGDAPVGAERPRRLEGPKNVLLMTEGFISEETWPDVQDAVSGGRPRQHPDLHA